MLKMRTLTFLTILLNFLAMHHALATTWDEPWQDEIIKKADYFVLASIDSISNNSTVHISILKDFTGQLSQKKLLLNNFYLLDLCSVSGGHGPEFNFETDFNYYFFLKQEGEANQVSIATPTSGYAALVENNVYATYRHSYHQALIEKDIYEQSMLAIFNHYHQIAIKKEWIQEFIQKYLSKTPSNGDQTFFNQHVALELIFHLKLDYNIETIKPFITTEHWHLNISALRALYSNTNAERNAIAISYLKNKKKDNFSKVVAVWALAHKGTKQLSKKQLKTLKRLSRREKRNYESGFGGNLMDPRICTHFPYLKDALLKLLD